MKVSFKLSIIFLGILLSPAAYAFPELPFCPAGGPPGWINYFNEQRDRNNWRRYAQYRALPAYGPAPYYRPTYKPVQWTPGNYSAPSYYPRRNVYPTMPSAYRNR